MMQSKILLPIISKSSSWSSLSWKLCEPRITISKFRGRCRERGDRSPPAPPSPPVHTPESEDTADPAPRRNIFLCNWVLRDEQIARLMLKVTFAHNRPALQMSPTTTRWTEKAGSATQLSLGALLWRVRCYLNHWRCHYFIIFIRNFMTVRETEIISNGP